MTISALEPVAAPRLPLPVRSLLTVLALFAAVFGAQLAVQTFLPAGSPRWLLLTVAATLGMAVAVGVALLLNRFVDRAPVARLRLGLDRWTVPWLLGGMVLAGVALVGTGLASAALGSSAPRTEAVPAAELLAATPILLVQAFVLQAIPEEVLFRGYLVGTALGRLPGWGVVLLSSALFGSLHIISNSAADTLAERLLYVVSAVGLGALAGAARLAADSTWAAIGVHGGFHVATTLVWLWLAPDVQNYAPYLTVQAAVQLLVAAAVLWWAVRAGRLDWRGRLDTAS